MVYKNTKTSDNSTVLKTPYEQPPTVSNNYPITKNTHLEYRGTIYSKYTRKTFGTEFEAVTKGATSPINKMFFFGISTVSNIEGSPKRSLQIVTNKYTTVIPSVIIKPPHQGVPKCKRRTPPCCVSGELSLTLGKFL